MMDTAQSTLAETRPKLPVVLHVPVVCPRCGTEPTGMPEGVPDLEIVECAECGQSFCAIAATAADVVRAAAMEDLTAWAPPEGSTDPIRIDTAAWASDVLSDFAVRCAAARTQKRMRSGLGPFPCDLDQLAAAAEQHQW